MKAATVTGRMQGESPSSVRPLGMPSLPHVRATLMRGGSSKGAFFAGEDLPRDASERFALLLACYGSPDARQIDGIGGADPLTSKAAIVCRSDRVDADLEYTFCQVSIDQPNVSTGGNCGNMLAGVAPFAILRGMVEAVEPETTVRIYTTNTGQVVTARIPVRDGLPVWDGDCRIAGVPGTGATISLDFGGCGGAVSGRLLPTSAATDSIVVAGRSLTVSLIDASTPFVFVRAHELGATGHETPDELRADTTLMHALEQVRGWAAVRLGLVRDAADAVRRSPGVPRVMMVSPGADYTAVDGSTITAGDVDLCVRQLAMQRPHKALAVTGAVCAAVACSVRGSVVADLAGEGKPLVRLGHPSGVLRVAARVSSLDGELKVESACIERTTRVLMDGYLYARASTVREIANALGDDR